MTIPTRAVPVGASLRVSGYDPVLLTTEGQEVYRDQSATLRVWKIRPEAFSPGLVNELLPSPTRECRSKDALN
jgi:hypothetical protein